jgi:hypothetical protein
MACRGPNAEDSWIDNAAQQDPITSTTPSYGYAHELPMISTHWLRIRAWVSGATRSAEGYSRYPRGRRTR